MNYIHALFLTAAIILAVSCSTARKAKYLKTDSTQVILDLPNKADFVPDSVQDLKKVYHDTLKVLDENGKNIFIMKAVMDSTTGEMVAMDTIKAAIVTSRFRNIAERKGKVDLKFQIIVPKKMLDKAWRIEIDPDMYILGDTLRQEPIFITGDRFRQKQLKGYEQYQKFITSISKDSTRFINKNQLEIFLKRNFPETYKFKTDTSYLTDLDYENYFGVKVKDAVEHYTNNYVIRRNQIKKDRSSKVFKKMIPVPIEKTVKLDSVVNDSYNDIVYDYTATVNTRPQLKKVEIVLSGIILQQGKKVYTIPKTKPMVFFISSLSNFTKDITKYMTEIRYRKAEANMTCRIDFALGKDKIDPDLGNNKAQIKTIKNGLVDLLDNKTYDIDSIVVTASCSPESSFARNAELAKLRSKSVTDYFGTFIKHSSDSIKASVGMEIGLDGKMRGIKIYDIKMISKSVPENWTELDNLVQTDSKFSEKDKESYQRYARIKNLDSRDARMYKETYYRYMKEKLFPQLRTVNFNFQLHRKGMVKDTVHTTVIDTVYMNGLQALKDRDYERAIALLTPYQDINTAVAYLAMDRNLSAKNILEKVKPEPDVQYMLAILYSRMGEVNKAVQFYLDACRGDKSYISKGNLDPEISVLIKKYGLNKEN